jgi:Xaa-Pro dipeptidase
MQQPYQPLYPAHIETVRHRWARALEASSCDAAVVHSGTPLYSFLDDYEYAFRPNPHFMAWLPLTHHSDSVLLFVPGKKPVLFYFQPDDYWYLPPSDPESWWADQFEIVVTRGATEWQGLLDERLQADGITRDRVVPIGDAPSLAEAFGETSVNPQGLVDRLHIARTRKTPYEIECIRQSARKAAAAHVEAERAFREGESEYGIHMRYLAACKHTDYQLPYNNIVALNTHGAVLHYQAREHQAPADSLSFLIDAGCTTNAYASDITRTYARNPGDFANLIEAMDALEHELVAAVKAGVDYRSLFLQSHIGIASVLASAGVIRVAADEAVETGLSSVFYPHGLGHFLGLQTHDVAGLIDNDGHPIPRPEGHPALRLTRVLEEDNVLTVEPGLYFIDTLLQKWRAGPNAGMVDWDRIDELSPYGGIRIEDNVVVQADGCENLTRAAFAALS